MLPGEQDDGTEYRLRCLAREQAESPADEGPDGSSAPSQSQVCQGGFDRVHRQFTTTREIETPSKLGG